MVPIEHNKWNQSIDDLRLLATTAPHRRTRERFLALYEIAMGSCAAQVALLANRHHQSVLAWVHSYNSEGPTALTYQQSGAPPFSPKLTPTLSSNKSHPPAKLSPHRP
jgi:hypothetical protein